MTDRIKGFVVTLDSDYREDDLDSIKTALRMITGVINVQPVVAKFEDHMNRERIKRELRDKIWEVLTS